MKGVELYCRVRHAVLVEGMSRREASRVFGIDRRTVDKTLKFSVPPGYRRTKPVKRPKLDPFVGIIDAILEADKAVPKKQRHTSKRVFERLRDEYGFEGGKTIVSDYIHSARQRQREMFVPLSHPPGHAQADFGEAVACIGGVKRKIHFLVVELPHSDTLFETDVVTAPEVAGQELRSTGDGGDWIGPFTANPAETKAGHIGIDVVFARGLYYANDSGGLDTRSAQWEVQARTIDDEGLPIGDWVSLGTESYTASTNSALRLSYKYAVSSGRYEVRMIRLDTIDASSRAGHELRWGAVRSYLEGTPEFGNVTLLAVKMRATDNLSQRSSRMINCVVTRKLSIWTSETGWSSPEPTRSIAWAFADACRASYGAGLAEGPNGPSSIGRIRSNLVGKGRHLRWCFRQHHDGLGSSNPYRSMRSGRSRIAGWCGPVVSRCAADLARGHVQSPQYRQRFIQDPIHHAG